MAEFYVGQVIQYRNGSYKGRVICTDRQAVDPLVVLLKNETSHEFLSMRKADGSVTPGFQSPSDIIPIPVKISHYCATSLGGEIREGWTFVSREIAVKTTKDIGGKFLIRKDFVDGEFVGYEVEPLEFGLEN